MTVTFKDVADLAGVSTQTVSRVTNGSDNVSEKTKIRVLAAIEQLGYVPNKAAQSLKANQNLIGVVSLNMSFHGAGMINNGIRLRAHELGYATAIAAVDNVCEQEIESAVRELIGQKVSSIVLNIPVSATFAELLTQKYNQYDLLFIDVPKQANVHRVCSANRAGATLGAEHLLAQGRQRFLLITGPAESYASSARCETWQAVLTAANATIVGIQQGNWLAAGGYQAMCAALAQTRFFDAVLVANDQMALGVLRALHEHGIDVPNTVAVVGFDGTEDSEFFLPPLTTVKQNFTEHGRIAVDQVLHLVDDGQPLDVELDVALITRVSSMTSAAPSVNVANSDNVAQAKQLLEQAMRLL
ncbi:transcriptional repressor of the lac operon [Photobacterium aphoticum]|uniref:Transcriptional repressor of the lac operon n=1 Tax=Photobacterium aphoticum TaxID=754436 RepID=A0A090QG57_9GAMM|nr:transcriptional repressor of the lac operon [Photobacterium aphoticum]